MTPQSIIAVLDGTRNSESALKTALAAGKLFNAYVEALHVEMPPEAAAPLVGEGFSGPAIEQILRSAKARAERRTLTANRLYQTHCVKAGIATADGIDRASRNRLSAGWWQTVGNADTILASRGRLFDLMVLGRPAESEGGIDALSLRSALFETGHAVLIAPNKALPTLGRSIVIAWDGSREAARSINAALPFIAKAKKVIVVTVEISAGPCDPTKIVGHLRRHNAKTKAVTVKRAGRKIGQALLAEAKRARADLLIMGAYGHSTIRELIFGGATRDILRLSNIPVLMAH